MRKLLVLLPFLFIFLECDHQELESDYETIGTASGNFGFRFITGDSDLATTTGIIHIIAPTYVYDVNSIRLDTFHLEINGISLNENPYLTELTYAPDKKYTFKLSSELGEASGEVVAPSISGIQFINLPETHNSEKDLKISWAYPKGEINNGAIFVETYWHRSELLPPQTTSYTIPSTAFEHTGGSFEISIGSIRYVKFPQLTNPEDDNVSFIGELDKDLGSYFGIFYAVHRYTELN